MRENEREEREREREKGRKRKYTPRVRGYTYLARKGATEICTLTERVLFVFHLF